MNKIYFAIALWLFVWPAVLIINIAIDALLPDSGQIIHTLITSFVLVPAMVWVVVPRVTAYLKSR